MCTSEAAVREQYRHPGNLNARLALQARFSTSKHPLASWVFDQFRFGDAARILELGCGTAWLWQANRERIGLPWRIILSDLSCGMLAEARRTTGDLGRTIRLVAANARAIPFGDAAFDAVVANHMLYHVEDLDRALGETRRVLRPGGKLYASTNGQDHMRDLAELLWSFDAAIDYGRERAERTFTLENGAARLRKHFAGVRVVPYEDSLVVTEVEPLVAYVLSLMGNVRTILSGPKLEDFRRFLEHRMRAQGAIRIRKSVGMFIATRM